MTESQLNLTDEALETLIKHYCRESGVRNLQKHIEKIFRKAAFEIVKSSTLDKLPETINVTNDKLTKFVGREKFTSDRMYDVTPPGVIMGLAWTAMGGSALYIEAGLRKRYSPEEVIGENKTPVDGSIEATGHLGDVMKESIKTAYTVAKNQLYKRQQDNHFLERAHIHVHVPEVS